MARAYSGTPGPFDNRVTYLPTEWASPIIDVMDTAQTVEMGIKDNLDIEPTAELIVGLTRLVLEEKVRRDAAALSELMEL